MHDFNIDKILSLLRSVYSHDKEFIGLHEPCFSGNEWTYVKECIDSGWVSSVGKFVDKFEIMLSEFTGTKKAVAVVNGTAALHTALKLTGVQYNDEVLCPTLTFVATANAIAYCGAIPHFVDIEEKTLGINPHKLKDYLKHIALIHRKECINKKTGRRIRAVVPVHTFGHPVDLDPLSELCKEFYIEMIEDAAEAIGTYYKNVHVGNWAKLSILSFNGNKTITTGGGGAIITNNEDLGRLAKHLTTTAKISHPWEYTHDAIGYNYRLPNINAALGCAQMEQLPKFIIKKRKLAEKLKEALRDIKGLTFFSEPPFAKSNYWLNALILDETIACKRDEFLMRANQLGIMTRPNWTLMHQLSIYKNCPAMDLSCAESLAKRIVNVPSSPFSVKDDE